MKTDPSFKRCLARVSGFVTGATGCLVVLEGVARLILPSQTGQETASFALPQSVARAMEAGAVLTSSPLSGSRFLEGSPFLLYLLFLGVGAIAACALAASVLIWAGYMGAKRSVTFLEKRDTLPAWAYGGWVLLAGMLVLMILRR